MDLTLKRPGGLDRNPAAVYLASLSPGSRGTRRSALERAAAVLTDGRIPAGRLDWTAVRYQHVAALRSRLAETLAIATANAVLSAVRGVLREAWRLGLVTGDDYQKVAAVEPVRGSVLPRGRALDSRELASLLGACRGGGTRGLRDAGVLAVLYGGGLRRAEAAGLDAGDYDRAEGRLTVRRGKGRRDRITYLAPAFCQRLNGWVAARGTRPGPLFCRVTPGGRVTAKRLSGQAVYDIVTKRREMAGVAHLSPHDLRRSCATHLLEAGADVGLVRDHLGHARVQTTLRYDRRGEGAKRAAAALLTCPA